MTVFIEGIDYEKMGFHSYRLIKDQSIQTDSRPPNGKGLRTKFGFMNKYGVLILYAGFCWDGATFALDTDTMMRASAFHDWFCNNVNNRTLATSYRREGDDLFNVICLEDGMSKFRARYAHIAVITCGQMTVADLEESCES